MYTLDEQQTCTMEFPLIKRLRKKEWTYVCSTAKARFEQVNDAWIDRRNGIMHVECSFGRLEGNVLANAKGLLHAKILSFVYEPLTV